MPSAVQCSRNARALRLSAPRLPVFPAYGSMLPDSPQALFPPGPFARNGLSLARNGPPSRASHSGVNVPGLLLRSLAHLSNRPVCLELHSALRIFPDQRPLHRSRPVAAFPARFFGCSPASTPQIGLLRPSWIKAFGGFCRLLVRLPVGPISVRSPKPVLSLGPASDHRSRFATFRRLALHASRLLPKC
jgi:hypothetical protein